MWADKTKSNEYHAKYQRELRKLVTKNNTTNRIAANKFMTAMAKAIPCTDCSSRYPTHVMDFDHLNPEDKKHLVSNISSKNYKTSKVFAEILKCEVVCANCHRQRTHDRKYAGTGAPRKY